MKSIVFAVSLALIPVSLFSYTDESYFSTTFGTVRFFRVFTPPDYDSCETSKRYPVIYYFHGCGGSYRRSGTYSSFNTGRPLLSAQIRLNRKPEKNNPVRILMQSEFLKVQPLVNDCHRNVADNFEYSYYEILLCEDGSVGISNHN